VATTDERFQFGENWRAFLSVLDEDRILAAEASVRSLLGIADLSGERLLDAGSGSGLFSLAARRLGATVHSFDYDPQSVACTAELRRRYFPDDPQWRVEEGSVLAREYLEDLGMFDVVYSWGVLHHTGAMWEAIQNVTERVKPGGLLALSLYNDQGRVSRAWWRVKRRYNQAPRPTKRMIVLAVGAYFEGRTALARIVTGKNPLPFDHWRVYRRHRGMSVWHDLVDWVGGYPFEVARPEDVFHFCHDRGFELVNLELARGHGCNEYVFRRRGEVSPAG
jgi:2-polyprenyl-6-hydroxyphenyl methylase/3-demethylubiquinone-9 3-methyltransferase